MADVTKPHLKKMFECEDLGTGRQVRDFFRRPESRETTKDIARQGVRKNRVERNRK